MKPKLPRALLWTDKTSMEEFLREPINERLYDFYLELKNTRWHFGPDNSALLLFNEIYYQLTRIEYENNLDFDMDEYTQEIDAKTGKEHGIIFVYKMFFAFLLLRQNNSNVARLFQNYVFFRYNRTWDERTNSALSSIMEEDKKYQVEFRPTPCRVNDLKVGELQWEEITNKFNTSSIKEVLNLWPYKEEKIKVLHLIESAYKRISRSSVKIENIMNYIRVSGNFFSKLYSELGNNDGTAANIEEYMENTITNADIDELFDSQDIKAMGIGESSDKIDKSALPEVFKTPKAEQLMQKLVNAGLLNNNWLPVNLSIAERGYLANDIAKRLIIKDNWKVMGTLWNENPETLRQGMYRALEQAKTRAFIEKLKNALDR